MHYPWVKMIDHKTKTIFIHATGSGGTSVEYAICGSNWWNVEPETKHITASRARKLYAEYWDDYFKFALVRCPYERAASLWHRFGHEHPDRKFIDFALDIAPAAHYIDEELDYVGKLEDIEIVWPIMCELGKFNTPLPHTGRSDGRKPAINYFALVGDYDLHKFAEKHREDIERYHYRTLSPCFG